MSDLRHSPISRKLTVMNVLVSAVALIAACGAFLAYDQYTFRESLVRNLSAEAQIVGSNSVSALTFNDPQSAEETLSAFSNLPHIITAAIFTADGQLFAQYARSPGERLANPGDAGGKTVATFRRDELIVRQPIVSRESVWAMCYIRSDLTETGQRLQQYGGIAAHGAAFFAVAGTTAVGDLPPIGGRADCGAGGYRAPGFARAQLFRARHPDRQAR